jgi:hypothetical protein
MRQCNGLPVGVRIVPIGDTPTDESATATVVRLAQWELGRGQPTSTSRRALRLMGATPGQISALLELSSFDLAKVLPSQNEIEAAELMSVEPIVHVLARADDAGIPLPANFGRL